MKICSVISTATLYVTWTGLLARAGDVGYLRRVSLEASSADASPMLRGLAMTGADDAPAPSTTKQEDSAQGVSWVPSDFRSGKVSLLPTFPPTPPTVSDTPVMAPSVEPAAQSIGVSWMPSDLRTGKVSILPTFPPQPTPASTTFSNEGSSVGVSWMPSDLRTGNVTLLPVFSHIPTAPNTKELSYSDTPRDLRLDDMAQLSLYPASRTIRIECDP